jgi:CP family cyanate transporter-like MFS transporter
VSGVDPQHLTIARIGIVAGGVTLPGIVKDRFTHRPGMATAGLQRPHDARLRDRAGAAVPARHTLGSWQASLASWAVPAAVAAAAWWPVARRLNRPESVRRSGPARLPWRSRSAWLLAAFMSAQSTLAYGYLAWLAPAHESRGWSPTTTGTLLGTLQLAQLVTALVLPTVAERRMDRRQVVLAAGACSITGAVLLLVAPGTTAWLATVILGLGLGGGFTLGLVLIADLAGSPAAATGIAAMTFLVCYLTASTAPIAVGALHDLSGGFTAPFGALALVAAMQFVIAARLRPHLRGSVS